MPDLLINPPSSPGWLRLQHLHVRRDSDISALLSSRSEIYVQRVLVGVCDLGLCWPLAFTGFKRNKDQERTVELIFFLEIRKLPDLKYVFHGISYDSILYFPFFSAIQMSVDLNANFINKKSLMSIVSSLNLLVCADFLPYLQPTLLQPTVLHHLRAAQKPQPYPLILVDAG